MEKSYFFDRFVMRRPYRELLLTLESNNKTMKELSDSSTMAYQHLCNVLQEAEKEKIVEKIKKKNVIMICLTHKGKIIAELCKGLKICIENWQGEESLVTLSKLSFAQLSEPDEKPENKRSDNVVKPSVVKPAVGVEKGDANGTGTTKDE